ncbi:MAG: carbohydrate binding family 9 domain-containing protein [Planctomycetes bacterium]|jgi:hypothetical protein|nr:carbohydrate binding family 9 domain-containing protein [Planctomycetota bacterium]
MPSLPARLLTALAAAAVAAAQGAPAVGEPPRPVAQVGRIDGAAAPVLDGRMDDACWIEAPAIGELTMVEPWLGRTPTQRTVVKLLHCRDQLYIGLWCYDRNAATICSTQRARDARLDPDDRVEILLDPFENRRTAYFFQIGAGGSIGDILISQNGGRFDKPWDAIWQGASQVTDEGWFAEVAIPFRSIPRREGARRWGFNLRRYVRTANEEYQWANPTQAVSFYRVSECGTIDGIGEVRGGIGLEVVPYVSAGLARDRSRPDAEWRSDPDAGGEIYYRVTPSMTLATTVLTDFGQTENDDRQINLNRFPLFFPEKRDFFLDGVGYFTFGASEAGGTRFLPFFTRRIGLAGDGTPIPLQWGMKLTGEAGPLEVGLLDVQADGTALTDDENLAVARLKYALGAQTTVGLLGSHGDPTSAGGNRVVGADFYHREPNFLGDLDLQATIDVLASSGSAGDDDGESFGIDLQSRGTEWEFGLGTRWVAADFRPALGFVRRRDTRQSNASVTYQPRVAEGSMVRRWLFELGATRAEQWEGETQDVEFAIERIGVQLQNDDEFALFARRNFERIDRDFTLFRDSTPIAVGDYWTTRVGAFVRTTEGRPWNAFVSASTGSFFDGRSDDFDSDLEWRTSALLHLGLGYSTSLVDLGPGRAFTTQIASARFDLHLTPELSLRNLLQFDNESEVLGWQSRLRWIYAPGCDFFAVIGTAWQREEDESLVPTQQSLQFKIAHTLRF